jgi:hypothetical protein
VNGDHLPGAGRGNGDRGLVGHELDDALVLLDRVAGLDQPLDDLSLDDAFPEIRKLELERGHGAVSSSQGPVRRAGPAP